MKRFLIAVALCAITAVSGAWTLQWNADANQTPGTTVTACLNGVCVSGVTGNSQSFSESYSPGTVLHGTAQAVPPAGYQCGEPLALCPPSSVAEIAQTIPSDQQYPNKSAWISTGGVMAAPTFVAQYATAFNTTASPKTAMNAVAINSGDVIVVVGESETANAATGWAPTYTENGSASFANSTVVSPTNHAPISAVTYSATANETLTITAVQGTSASLYFGANAVRFSGSSGIGNIASNTGTGLPSVSITTTQDNSAIVVIATDWDSIIGTQTFTSNGGAGSPTSLTGYPPNAANSSAAIAYYADAGTAGSKTVGMSSPSSQVWVIVAIEVKGSAGGNGSVSITGSAGAGGLGAVSVSGSALASLVGLAGSATGGAVGAGGGATLVGLSGASGFGTLSASGTRL